MTWVDWFLIMTIIAASPILVYATAKIWAYGSAAGRAKYENIQRRKKERERGKA